MTGPRAGRAEATAVTAADDPVRLSDIVVTLLMPAVREAVSSFYEPYLTLSPTVVPYYGSQIVEIRGGERFREGIGNSHYTITVEVLPYVGPHLSVGKDRLTLRIRPDGVTVERFEHLKSHPLTPNYQSLIKKPLP